MSTEFYFKTWLKVLKRLEALVDVDMTYRTTKRKENVVCRLSQRLAGTLGAYYRIYNEAVECLRQNVQVQKTMYIAAIINAVVSRILELKHQLQKLEGTKNQFLGNGLMDHKITPFDTELIELPEIAVRQENIQNLIEEAFIKAKEKKEELERLIEEEKKREQEELMSNDKALALWDEDNAKAGDENFDNYDTKAVLDDETLERRKRVILIQTQEKTRQVTTMVLKQKLKRQKWVKQLDGTLEPEAPLELRHRSAKIIQRVCREYFKLKRSKLQLCKTDEILDERVCKPFSFEERIKNHDRFNFRYDITKKYDSEWKTMKEELKQIYFDKKRDEIADDVRDELRIWLRKWYDELNYFYDIPHESSGGSQLIVKDEVIEPSEWKEAYKKYLADKTANKGKSASQKKQDRERKKREEAAKKREEKMKNDLKEKLEKKLLKDPKNHPGFEYPESKKINILLKAIEEYHNRWDELDKYETPDVKHGSVRSIDMEKICMEVKMEVRKEIDKEMMLELKKLKKALKKDYELNEKEMPEPMKKPRIKRKKEKVVKIKHVPSQALNGMEDLITKNIMTTYPRRAFTDFLGDHNYAGDELNCYFIPAVSYAGETRQSWWDNSRETLHGFRRILLVGPRGSGKTMLVHALASANDAVLLELNPLKVDQEQISNEYLAGIIKNVVLSAKLAQPAVIHLKHVHRLFYTKTPQHEKSLNLPLIRKFFINKLFKGIKKEDQVTIIGTCIEPWLCNSAKLLKKLSEVVLVPNTNYTAVVKLLSDWVLSNRQIPRELDVHALAHVLQGCSYGALETALDNFLTGERVARIAMSSLTPLEIFDYIQETGLAETDYNKYSVWYSEKTEWGKREMKKIEEQKQFKELQDKYQEKMMKKKWQNKKNNKRPVQNT